MKKLLIVILYLIFTSALIAQNYYAATTGNSGGDGSINDPFDITTAFGEYQQSNPTEAADTVFIRGGTYAGNWEVFVNGLSSSSRLVFMPYNNERVTFDANAPGVNSIDQWLLRVLGNNLEFRDLELMSSSRLRNEDEDVIYKKVSFEVIGTDCRLINNIIHNLKGNGLASFGDFGENLEVYGNIVFYHGWDNTDRGHGHGMYLQNQTESPKYIRNNIEFNGCGIGIHCYGYTSGVGDLYLDENTIFNSGALSRFETATNIYAEGNSDGMVIDSSYIYNIYNRNGITLDGDGLVTNNTVFRGTLQIRVSDAITVNNNTVYLDESLSQLVKYENPGSAGSIANWDYNTYYNSNGGTYNWGSFSAWQSFINGYGGYGDANSVEYTSFPSSNTVEVIENYHEAKRTHIIIYNFEDLTNVPVDVEYIYDAGDSIFVYDVENILNGTCAAYEYGGSGSINIPMDLTAMSDTIGGTYTTQLVHSDQDFGVYVTTSRRLEIDSNSGFTPTPSDSIICTTHQQLVDSLAYGNRIPGDTVYVAMTSIDSPLSFACDGDAQLFVYVRPHPNYAPVFTSKVTVSGAYLSTEYLKFSGGIEVTGDSNELKNDTISNSTTYGVSVNSIDTIILANCVFAANDTAIIVYDSRNITITNNSISGDGEIISMSIPGVGKAGEDYLIDYNTYTLGNLATFSGFGFFQYMALYYKLGFDINSSYAIE